jgi:hypothetical protein
MHRLDPDGSRDVVRTALSDGSKEMRVAAVECLGTGDDDLAYLLEQVRSKARDVRAAALRALATGGAATKPDVVTTLKKAIAGADLELFVDRVKQCPLPEIQDYVLEQAESQFAELLKTKDKKLQGPMVARLQQLVSCLEDRTDAKAEAFLLKCFEQAPALAGIKSEPSGGDLNELVAHVLSVGTAKMQRQLVAAHKTLGGQMLSSALFAARATLTPAAFYDEFGPVLKGLAEKRTKKNATEHDRAQALSGVLTATQTDDGDYPVYRPWMYAGRRYYVSRAAKPLPALDPRWLDAAVDAGLTELVCHLARPGHAKANAYLAAHLAGLKKPHEALEVLRTMVRVGHPDAADALADALTKQAKESSSYFYYSYWYVRMIPDLPRNALPRIEALLPTLPDKMVDQLMDSVMALKNKPESEA